MYELGRNLVGMEHRFPDDFTDRIVVSVEKGYSREQDVRIQTKLAIPYDTPLFLNVSPETHAKIIHFIYEKLIENN